LVCTPTYAILAISGGTLIANDVNKIKYICRNVGRRQDAQALRAVIARAMITLSGSAARDWLQHFASEIFLRIQRNMLMMLKHL